MHYSTNIDAVITEVKENLKPVFLVCIKLNMCQSEILTVEDMDGTLLNTEDIYTEVSSELLAQYGKGPLTWDIKLQLQGLPGPHANELVIKHYDIPLTVEEYTEKIMDIQKTKWHKCTFLPGVEDMLKKLKEKSVPMALGTSSNTVNFERKTQHLTTFLDFFGDQIVTGDDGRIPRGKGKPHPYIWYVCLEGLNKQRQAQGLETIQPHECLIFEDGVAGVYSGLSADAHVIWIPHPEAKEHILPIKDTLKDKKLEVIDSLENFNVFDYLEY